MAACHPPTVVVASTHDMQLCLPNRSALQLLSMHPCWTACLPALLQIKQEAELRGHTEGVTNLAWHPVHPDKLASIAGQEKSVR